MRFDIRRLTPLALSFICLALSAARVRADAPEDRLIAVLRSRAPAGDKAAACNELKRVGTARCVPALAALLTDKELSHPARYALESLPYPEAGAALRAAVAKTSGLLRAGVVASLGARRDGKAVGVLAPLLLDRDGQVAAATAVALGEIGTPAAASALTGALPKTGDKLRAALGDGLLRCARHLVAEGKTKEAAAIYQRLCQADQVRVVRRGGRQGLLQVAGPAKLRLIREYLSGTDADARAVAADQIEGLSKEDLQALVKDLTTLPEAGQEAVLAALTLRDDRSFLPAVLDAARSKKDRVRLAALKTLGRLGDVSALPVLTEALSAKGTHDVARHSLEILSGRGINEKLIARMKAEQIPLRRAELIDILAEREAVAAVPALLQETLSDRAEVRGRAMTALGRLAAPKDVPAMLRGLLRTTPGAERDSAEQAVLSVCQQIPQADKRADPILAGMAKFTEPEKAAVLPVLGRTGAPAALGMIRSALKSKDSGLHAEGIRALANWPDPVVADDLIRLARETTNSEHRRWALAGAARAATSPGQLAPDRRLALLKQAMQLASQDDTRQLILERAALVKTVETLRFVLPYLDQPALAGQACRTVVKLAHSRPLRLPNQKEFAAALEKVIKVSKEAGVVDEARKYLAGL